MDTDTFLISQTLALALIAGIAAQVGGERLSIPSIVPLLVFGTLLGPEGVGWVQPKALGSGLEVLVSFSVAIILFEGSLALEWEFLRSRGRAIARLVTLGALVTMLGAALAAWLILPVSLSFAFLLGSLVIVTGPTVIRPLLRRVRIQRRIGMILETEGVLIDPIGAIIAFVVFEVMVAEEFSLTLGPGSLVARLGVGVVVGIASGILLGFSLRRRWASEPELANLAALAVAIATFVGSNALQKESGLMAVVAAGLVLSGFRVPGKLEVLKFKGVLTTVVISLLFVLLSADIDWTVLLSIGWAGPLWVAVLMFAVRPACVFLSTRGADLSTRDKLFLSWISPRGIVAASVASLFAIYLERHGVRGGELLQALVFLTIAITVLTQGLTAGAWARFLSVSAEAYGVVIVGASALGRLVGSLLQERGRPVGLIDSNARHCARAQVMGLPAFAGNCLDSENLERIGLRAADQLVALTPNGEVNYLVARLAREEFGVPRALALQHRDDKPPSELTRASHRIERAFGPTIPDEVHPSLRGRPVVRRFTVIAPPEDRLGALDFGGAIPLVRVRDGRAEVCGESTELDEGDELVFLGDPDGVRWLEATPDADDREEATG